MMREKANVKVGQIMNPLEHAERVNNALQQVPLQCALGFGASICERAKDLMVRALGRETVPQFDFFWGRVWRSVAALDDWSDDIIPFFETLVPGQFHMEDDSLFFLASTVFYSFAAAVDKDSACEIGYVSEASMALLDHWIYENAGLKPGVRNDSVVHANPLLLREMERQQRDLLTCQSGRDPQKVVFELWKSSSSEALIQI